MEYKNDLVQHGCKCDDTCKKDCEVYAGISVPIEIEPEAKVGEISVECYGEPIVDTENCGKSYKIVITQQVYVKIPITYSVKAQKCKEDKRSHD